MLTPADLEFLKANEEPRGRWLYDSNTAPAIDELCARGLMLAAPGEFGRMRDTGARASILGVDMPVMKLNSLYELTPAARDHYFATGSIQ